MMAQPRCHGNKPTCAQVDFFHNLRLYRDKHVFASCPMLHQLLEDAWSRLQRSGVNWRAARALL
jgi:hypothetical protein